MPLLKKLENIHCNGVMAEIGSVIGRIKTPHRTWLDSQGPLWTLAQGQLLPVPQASAEARRSAALFSQEGLCCRLGISTQQSTISHLLYFYVIVYLAVIACGRDHAQVTARLWNRVA